MSCPLALLDPLAASPERQSLRRRRRRNFYISERLGMELGETCREIWEKMLEHVETI